MPLCRHTIIRSDIAEKAIEEEEVGMTRLQILGMCLTLGAALSLADSAQAQGNDFGPYPTLSPWFNLYQKNNGPLDNYHMFVRPRINLNDDLQQHQAAIRRNSAGLNSLDQDLTQLQEHASGMRPTGAASVFMNYSHYYNAQGSAGGATRGPAVQRDTWAPQPASAASSMGSMR
jgi:hypothetical protein